MNGFKEGIYPDGYPARILCLSLGHTGFSYALGTLIMMQWQPWLGAAYLVLCVAGLFMGLKYRCRFCWYFGRTCYAGLGRAAKFLFEPGAPGEFPLFRNVIPVLVPSFTTLLLPLIVILVDTLLRFSLPNLALLLGYILLVIAPGFLLRKSLFCPHCKQAELGCPAFEGMQGRHRAKP